MRVSDTVRQFGFTALIGAALLPDLAGCGTTRLSDELKPFVGRDVRELVARLGKPTGRREMSAERVYVWASASDGVLATTPFSASPGGSGDVSYAGSSSPGGLIAVKFGCTLEISVDPQDIIQHYQLEGSHAGCSRYRKLLRR